MGTPSSLPRFFAATLISLSCARAATFPPPTVPDNLGVNTGVTTLKLGDADFRRIAESGMKYVRFDLMWGDIEKDKGVYDWAAFDGVVEKLKQNGLKPVFILCYGNKLYAPEGDVRTPEARRGYANFAAAAVTRYNGKIPGTLWELWNEPNSDNFWKPKRNPTEFVAMVKEASAAIRRADRTATIVSGGILELFWDVTQKYLEACLKAGLLREVDGLGVHFYGGGKNVEPERIIGEVAYLRKVMAAAGARSDFPILNTEFGARLEEYEKAPDRQLAHARTYLRMYLLCLLLDVKLNIFYEWHWDEDKDKHGILNADGSPRKVHTAIRTVATALGGYQFEKRLTGFDDADYVLVFRKGNQRVLAAWTAGADHPVEVRAGGTAAALPTTDMLGVTGKIPVNSGKLNVPLTGSPIYIDAGTAPVNN